VVEAADAVALDPASAELRAPVRAAEVHQVWLWTRRYWSVQPLASVEGVVLAHDTQRLGVPGRQRAPHVHRVPERAQEAPRRRPRARVREVARVYSRAALLDWCAAGSHAEPPRIC